MPRMENANVWPLFLCLGGADSDSCASLEQHTLEWRSLLSQPHSVSSHRSPEPRSHRPQDKSRTRGEAWKWKQMPKLYSELQKSILLFRAWGKRRRPSLNSGGKSKLCLPLPWLSPSATSCLPGLTHFWLVQTPCMFHRLPGRLVNDRKGSGHQFRVIFFPEPWQNPSEFSLTPHSSLGHSTATSCLDNCRASSPSSLHPSSSASPTYHLPLQATWLSILQSEWPSQSPNLIRPACPGFKPITPRLKTQLL